MRQRVPASIELEHRHVGPFVGAENTRLEFAAISEDHGHFVGARDHMTVGHDDAVRRNDDPRAERVLDPLFRYAERRSLPEKAAKERIVEERRDACLHHPAAVDVDHRRRSRAHHRRERKLDFLAGLGNSALTRRRWMRTRDERRDQKRDGGSEALWVTHVLSVAIRLRAFLPWLSSSSRGADYSAEAAASCCAASRALSSAPLASASRSTNSITPSGALSP